MTIPSKFYEILKFLVQFGTGLASIVSVLLIGIGVGDKTINIVVLCINTIVLLITLFVSACSKCHWKAVAEDGTETDIEPIEDEDKTMGFIAEIHDN